MRVCVCVCVCARARVCVHPCDIHICIAPICGEVIIVSLSGVLYINYTHVTATVVLTKCWPQIRVIMTVPL